MEIEAVELLNEHTKTAASPAGANIDLYKVALLIKELAQMRQESRRQAYENATQAAELERLRNALSSMRNADNVNNNSKGKSIADNNKKVGTMHKSSNINKANLSETCVVKKEKEEKEEELCKLKELLKWKYRYCHLRHKYKYVKSHHARELIGIQHMVEQLAVNKEQITPTRAIEMSKTNDHNTNNTITATTTTTEKATDLSIHKTPFYEQEEYECEELYDDKSCELHSTPANKENTYANYKVLSCYDSNTNCLNVKCNANLMDNANLVKSTSKPSTLADLPEMVYFDENDAFITISANDHIKNKNNNICRCCLESNKTNTSSSNVEEKSKTNAKRKTNIALFANTLNSSLLHKHHNVETNLCKESNNKNSNKSNAKKTIKNTIEAEISNTLSLEEKEEWFDKLLLCAMHEEQCELPYKQSNSKEAQLHPYNIAVQHNSNKENEYIKRESDRSRGIEDYNSSLNKHHVLHNMYHQQEQWPETSSNAKRETRSLAESVEYALNKSIQDKQEQIRAKVYAEFDRHDKLLEQINRLQQTASMYTWRKPSDASSS